MPRNPRPAWRGIGGRHAAESGAGIRRNTQLAKRVAEQVAFGQAHRLFNGGFFSSNVTVNGALLDYGGMRSLPNWVNARTLDGVVGFGEELRMLDKLIESLSWSFAKYRAERGRAPLDGPSLRAYARKSHKVAFARECLRAWCVDPDTDPVLASAIIQPLSRYFSQQQKFRVNYKHGEAPVSGWLYEHVAAPLSHAAHGSSMEVQTLAAIDYALRHHFSRDSDRHNRLLRAASCALRFLRPRDELDREGLQRSIQTHLETELKARSAENWIEAFVIATVGRSRRHWRRLPVDLCVQAQVTREGSTALLCVDMYTREQIYWLEGIRIKDHYRLFDTDLTSDQVRFIRCTPDSPYWTGRLSYDELATSSLAIPPMQIAYERPPARLKAAREATA